VPTPYDVTSSPNNRTSNMRKHCIALVRKDSNSDYGVSFPDFPGAVTAAPSLDEALARAGEALALHVEGMAEDGEPIPPPSGFAEVIKDNPDAMTVLCRSRSHEPCSADERAGRWQPSRSRRRIRNHHDRRPPPRPQPGLLARAWRWMRATGSASARVRLYNTCNGEPLGVDPGAAAYSGTSNYRRRESATRPRVWGPGVGI
jgi:predicted RNase H-like HicB family nuclease